MTMKPSILVVEDDEVMRTTCVRLFDKAGYSVASVSDGEAAIGWLREQGEDCVVLTDVRMPGMDGMALLEAIRSGWPGTEVIVMTGFGTIDNAVQAMKQGAADYVTKPFNKDELLLAVERVARMRGLRTRVDTLQQGMESRYRFDSFIAGAESMQSVLEGMIAASRSKASLLITGESGTGKDVVARSVHFAGPRAESSFVPVNCASLPAELIESELFGALRGAYTGATEARQGLIRRADGGTLMLDEVTEMPVGVQAKLLRVLQEKRVRPVGATDEVEVDFRLITATNRDLGEALENGALREDLYYRISVLQIHLPPLRERCEDILPLFRHFLDTAASEGEMLEGIEPDAADLILAHDWPGNVRELANLAERCVAMGVERTISVNDIRRHLTGRPRRRVASEIAADMTAAASSPSLAGAEEAAIRRALRESGNNKSEAARRLGIARKTLYEKMRRYGIER